MDNELFKGCAVLLRGVIYKEGNAMRKYLANLCLALLFGLCLPYTADARICFLPGGCHDVAPDTECGTNGYKSLETCEAAIGDHERCELGARACYYPECMYRDTYDCEKKTGATKCALDENNCAYEMTPPELCKSLGYTETTDLSEGVGANCYDCDPCDYVSTMYKCTVSLKIGFTLVDGVCTPGGYKDSNCWNCKVHYYDCEEISPNENYTIVGDSCIACTETVTYNYEGTGCTATTFENGSTTKPSKSECTECSRTPSYTNYNGVCGATYTGSEETRFINCSSGCSDYTYTSEPSCDSHCFEPDSCEVGGNIYYKCVAKDEIDKDYEIQSGKCVNKLCTDNVVEGETVPAGHPCRTLYPSVTNIYACPDGNGGGTEYNCSSVCDNLTLYEYCTTGVCNTNSVAAVIDGETKSSVLCMVAADTVPTGTVKVGEKCKVGSTTNYWYLDCTTLTQLGTSFTVKCGDESTTVTNNVLSGLKKGIDGCTGTPVATCGGSNFYKSDDECFSSGTIDVNCTDDYTLYSGSNCFVWSNPYSLPEGYYIPELSDATQPSWVCQNGGNTKFLMSQCENENPDCGGGYSPVKGMYSCNEKPSKATDEVTCGKKAYYNAECEGKCSYDFSDEECAKLTNGSQTTVTNKCSNGRGQCGTYASYDDLTQCSTTTGKTALLSCSEVEDPSDCCNSSGGIMCDCN